MTVIDVRNLSLLWLDERPAVDLPAQTVQDLALGDIATAIAPAVGQRKFVLQLLTRLPLDRETIAYRQQILTDLLERPALLNRIVELLPDVAELGIEHTKLGRRATLFEVVGRLNDLDLYVTVVEGLCQAFDESEPVQSPALQQLQQALRQTLEDPVFQRLVGELPQMLAQIQRVASVTIGVNLDSKLRPVAATLLEINAEPFGRSSLWQRLFGDELGELHELPDLTPETLTQIMGRGKRELNPLMVPLFRDLANILEKTSRPIARALQRYKQLHAGALFHLHDELIFYVGAARLIHELSERGLPFSRPEILAEDGQRLLADNAWNVHLALRQQQIVKNDVHFDDGARVLIVTGPNAGGKTTYLQTAALTQLFAQIGLHAPAERVAFSPVDNILTHYQVEERLALGTGRFGEEAQRLYQLFERVTTDSLVLLNEPLTSTSAGESLYLLQDIVRLFDQVGARVLIATHLHQLAGNGSGSNVISLVASPVTADDAGSRSYRIVPGPPLGRSFARELAKRYGIDYDQLQQMLQQRKVL